MAGCDQVVLLVGSLMSVFKLTNHKVCSKMGSQLGQRTDGEKEIDTGKKTAQQPGLAGLGGFPDFPICLRPEM